MSDSNHPSPIRELTSGSLETAVYSNRQDMGKAAALYAIDYLRSIQDQKDEVRIVVGSAPSQDEFYYHLSALPESKAINWSKFVVFHMDEYVGLTADHSASFRAYQREHFVSKVPLKAFHEIRGEAEDPETECQRLCDLLSEAPIDLACCGIGENGHLAFNDPPVANFEDPVEAKVVQLDDICRQQQVNDGCFPNLDSVPTHAITLTLKVFREAAVLSCVIPATTKAKAVAATINGPISTDCPATLIWSSPQIPLLKTFFIASRVAVDCEWKRGVESGCY